MVAASLDPSVERNTIATAAKSSHFQIPSLDGLRAISFFVVFLAHAGLDRVIPGGFGVTVFFFLSGFLITTLMRAEFERTHSVHLGDFYLRRALRILPPFYIVLATATVLAEIGVLRGDQPPQALPIASQWLHFANYWIAFHGASGIPSGTGVYWSLAVEEHFYLLFPAVFVLLHRMRLSPRHVAFAFWSACAVVLLWRCVLVMVFHAPPNRTYMCSDTRIDSIAFGCALAVWRNPFIDAVSDVRVGRSSMRPLAHVLFGGVILLSTFLVRNEMFRQTARYTLQGIGLTPLFVAAIRWPEWGPFKLMNWRPLRLVGTLSYSLYLVHQAILSLVEQHLAIGPVARASVALASSFAVAWAMYRLIERPCAKLRRRLAFAG